VTRLGNRCLHFLPYVGSVSKILFCGSTPLNPITDNPSHRSPCGGSLMYSPRWQNCNNLQVRRHLDSSWVLNQRCIVTQARGDTKFFGQSLSNYLYSPEPSIENELLWPIGHHVSATQFLAD